MLLDEVKLEHVPGGAPNIPCQHHFLMYKNNLSLWQWYKAKSMDQEI